MKTCTVTVTGGKRGEGVQAGRRWPKATTCTIVLLLLQISIGAAADETRIGVGKVQRTQGDCAAEYASASRPLEADGKVFFQDFLKTGDGARLAVKLDDESELTLGENAALLVDEFVYRPENSGGKLDLQVLKGAFLFVGGKLDSDPEARVNIGTPVSALGIRGTTVWGGMIDGAFGVLVLDGEVEVINDGGRVLLGPGEGTMIAGAAEAPSAPKKWPEAKVQRAFATVSFSGH